MGNRPVCVIRNPACIDSGTSARMVCPPPDRTNNLQSSLDRAIRAFESEGFSFGVRFIQDGPVRENYFREIRKMSASIEQRVLKPLGNERLSPMEGAAEANRLRNEIMKAARLKSSDIGAAWARKIKKEDRTLPQLQERYAQEQFGRPFDKLKGTEQDQIYLTIVKSSGRDLDTVTHLVRWGGRMAKGLVLLTLALAVYNIVTTDDHLDAFLREEGDASAGFLAGVAGGEAGLFCGPLAFVCVPVGVFAGGVLGAYGMDDLFTWMRKQP